MTVFLMLIGIRLSFREIIDFVSLIDVIHNQKLQGQINEWLQLAERKGILELQAHFFFCKSRIILVNVQKPS